MTQNSHSVGLHIIGPIEVEKTYPKKAFEEKIYNPNLTVTKLTLNPTM